MKILLVEDDETTREGMVDVIDLMLPDAEILTSGDPDTASQLIETFRQAIDIIIADGHLGKHRREGLLLLEQARKTGIANLIFFSGQSIDEDEKKPDIHYLQKGTDPVNLERLLQQISSTSGVKYQPPL